LLIGIVEELAAATVTCSTSPLITRTCCANDDDAKTREVAIKVSFPSCGQRLSMRSSATI
jgi:hypothetical protein